MHRGYKCRLYPNQEQRIMLAKTFGSCRWFYNWSLAETISAYRTRKVTLSRYDLQAQLPILKRQEETAWLKEVDSCALQTALIPLESSFRNFFAGRTGFPKSKNKRGKQTYTTNYSRLANGKLKLGKFADPIRLRGLKPFTGKLGLVTISKTPTGKYFASFQVDDGLDLPPKAPISEAGTIGVDLGLTHFATLSTGEKIPNPRHAKKLERLLKHRQRQHSKSIAGTARREKRRRAVARIHERICNQRKDFLHKLSTRLIRENQAVAVEDLAVSNMVQNRSLAKSISQAAWSTFVEMLRYKADWYGKTILTIGRFQPSSKLCTCGQINHELQLCDRSWTCSACGATHDRDILAANNIKRMALQPIRDCLVA